MANRGGEDGGQGGPSGVDEVYADKRSRVVDFAFDDQVAAVFPDMIRRSVPGYETLVALCGVIAERYLQPDCNVYDLGCSLGAAMLSIHGRIADPSVRFIGVDNSESMLRQCRRNLSGVIDSARLRLVCRDAREVAVRDAGLVVLNFTLQFIDPADRLDLLRRIHAGLKTGGILILSEKTRAEDGGEAGVQQALHDQFKAANGYSDLEIAQKRAALEKVMTPDGAATHLARLRQAGFGQAVQWFQAFDFRSFLARK